MTILPLVIAMCVLLGLSAFFSGSETALFSLTAAQTHKLSISRHRVEHVAARLMREPDAVLVTLLICNMIINVSYFTFAAVGTLIMQSGSASPWLTSAWAVGALVVLVLVGEVVPKVFSFAYNTRVAPLVAVPLFLIHQGLRPLNRLLRRWLVRPLTRLAHPAGHVSTVTLDELRELLEVSEQRGVLHADETMILHEIIDLGETKVRDVMVPRVQMVAFDIDRPIDELRDLLRSSGHAKLPVYRGDLDHVEGWASARRVFLRPDAKLADILLPVLYTAELATVEQLLEEFRRNRAASAIVVDEFGGTAGLVTLADVLDEIVGQVQATTGQPLVQQIGPTEYLLSGQLPIHDWAESFGHELDDPRLVTVGGLVIKLIGRLPKVGDKARYANVTFTVERMGVRRIDLLRLTLDAGEGRA